MFRETALLKRRSTRCAPHRIWEKSDFSSFSTYERRLCYPRNLSTEIDFENNLLGGCLREGYLCLKTGRDYRYFPSLIFEDSRAQILKFFTETSHCLFLSLEKTPKLICVSDFFPLACLANAYLLELTYNFTFYRFLDE